MMIHDIFVQTESVSLGPAWQSETERGPAATEALRSRRHEYLGTLCGRRIYVMRMRRAIGLPQLAFAA
jgi:hypothetical protein